MFSIFNPKHSPLMLDANSPNFLLQEKKPEFRSGKSKRLLCVLQWSPVHLMSRELGLQHCFAAFLASQVFVACYHSGLGSLQWPLLQDGAKPSDTGLQGGHGPC